MKNDVTSIFADRLQDLISDSGKKITMLAEEIGISSGALSNYQNDKAEAGICALKKIADYFDVPYDYLLGKTDSKKRKNINIAQTLGLSDKAISIISELNKQSKKLKKVFVSLIESKHFYQLLYLAWEYFESKQENEYSDNVLEPEKKYDGSLIFEGLSISQQNTKETLSVSMYREERSYFTLSKCFENVLSEAYLTQRKSKKDFLEWRMLHEELSVQEECFSINTKRVMNIQEELVDFKPVLESEEQLEAVRGWVIRKIDYLEEEIKKANKSIAVSNKLADEYAEKIRIFRESRGE